MDITASCANCKAPMTIPLYSLAPLQIGSKRATFYCDRCNKPSILNMRSRLAGAFVSISVLIVAVGAALLWEGSGVIPVALLVVGALGGMAVGTWVSSLIPTLVRPRHGA